jgi:hypothetical protein
LGVAPFIVSKLLNHTEPGVTFKVYNKFAYDTEKCAALIKWDRRLAEIISGEKPSNVIEGAFAAA